MGGKEIVNKEKTAYTCNTGGELYNRTGEIV
jgi:hypothetical protein